MSADIPHENSSSANGDATHSDNSNEQSSDQPPPIIPGSHVPPAVGNTRTSDHSKESWLERGKFIVEVLTLIVITVYTGIAYRQWEEMRKATKATRDAVRVAASTLTETQRSNTAQEAANKTLLQATIDNSSLDQRAWVGVVGADTPELRPKADFSVILHALNSGHTPALNLRSEVVLHSLPSTEPFVPVYGKVKLGSTVVQPGEVFNLPTSAYPVTQPQIDSVLNGSQILYVYGRMTYRDIFHRTHHTTFCKIISKAGIRACTTYNYAD